MSDTIPIFKVGELVHVMNTNWGQKSGLANKVGIVESVYYPHNPNIRFGDKKSRSVPASSLMHCKEMIPLWLDNWKKDQDKLEWLRQKIKEGKIKIITITDDIEEMTELRKLVGLI